MRKYREIWKKKIIKAHKGQQTIISETMHDENDDFQLKIRRGYSFTHLFLRI